MVKDLHHIGLLHGDLEPRNVARMPGGGFCLIGFSESRERGYKESQRVRFIDPNILWLFTSFLGGQSGPETYISMFRTSNALEVFME